MLLRVGFCHIYTVGMTQNRLVTSVAFVWALVLKWFKNFIHCGNSFIFFPFYHINLLFPKSFWDAQGNESLFCLFYISLVLF